MIVDVAPAFLARQVDHVQGQCPRRSLSSSDSPLSQVCLPRASLPPGFLAEFAALLRGKALGGHLALQLQNAGQRGFFRSGLVWPWRPCLSAAFTIVVSARANLSAVWPSGVPVRTSRSSWQVASQKACRLLKSPATQSSCAQAPWSPHHVVSLPSEREPELVCLNIVHTSRPRRRQSPVHASCFAATCRWGSPRSRRVPGAASPRIPSRPLGMAALRSPSTHNATAETASPLVWLHELRDGLHYLLILLLWVTTIREIARHVSTNSSNNSNSVVCAPICSGRRLQCRCPARRTYCIHPCHATDRMM